MERSSQARVNVSENCYKCSIFLRPPSPHAGGDARAPRTHVLQSFRPSLQAVRTPQPAQAGFALDSRGLQPDGTRCIADLMLNLHQPDGTRAGTPALPGRTCFNHSAHRSRR
jgi:hypothetical protein